VACRSCRFKDASDPDFNIKTAQGKLVDCSGTTRKWALGLTTAASVAQSDLVAGERLANVAGEQSDESAALDKMVKDGGCDKIKDYMGDFVSVIKFVYMATSDEGKLHDKHVVHGASPPLQTCTPPSAQ
jgi:hypothetical protein